MINLYDDVVDSCFDEIQLYRIIYFPRCIYFNFFPLQDEFRSHWHLEWTLLPNVITSTVTVSTQLPSTHSWKESTPTNQSGLGLMRAIMLIRVWLPSKKARVTLVPSPWGIGGPVNEWRLLGESPSASNPSALPVSTYNLAPVDNLSPNLYRV